MMTKIEIVRELKKRGIQEYCLSNFRNAVKAATMDEAISIMIGKEPEKQVDSDMLDYQAYNSAIRQAQYFAQLAAEVGDSLSADDILATQEEKSESDKKVNEYLEVAKKHFNGACRWAAPDRLVFPEYLWR